MVRRLFIVEPFSEIALGVAAKLAGCSTIRMFHDQLLFKPSDAIHIGAAYRTDMTIDFKGNATITQIPTGNAQFDAIVATQLPPSQAITTSIPFPAVAVVGVST